MGRLADVVKDELAPYLGPMVADTCVRATALSLGKSSEDLGASDIAALENSISRYLGPVAPRAVIAMVLSNVKAAL